VAFTIAGPAIDPHNGLNTDGLTCDAFNEETWFPSSSPVANTAEPGTPDATDTSGPAGNSGQTGHYLITVPTSGSYWVATYNSWDPTVIAWVKVLSHPHTNLQGWTAAVIQSANRNVTETTIAAGSNGVALPTGTINVAATAPADPLSFASSGYLLIQIGSAWTVVKYTSKTGTTFTGCTGGSGTLLTAQIVIQGYLSSSYRRQCYVQMSMTTSSAGDDALLSAISTIGGTILNMGTVGIPFTNITVNNQLAVQLTFPVDPGGYYGVLPRKAGTAVIGAGLVWIETDF